MLNRERNFGSFRMVLCLATILTFMIAQPASATEFPGPDEFGYVANKIDGNLREINSEHLFLGDDATSGPIPLPFPFLFYGVYVSEVYISSNGFISFSSLQGEGCCEGGPIPNPLIPNNIIAGFWEDLNPTKGGSISYATVGPDGNRQFVVEFKEIPHFYDNLPVTFQIILHEGSNDIELQYGSAISDGGNHTVGIENADGTVAMQIASGDISFNHEGFIINNRLIEKFEVQSANVSFGRGQELDKYDIAGQFTLSEFSDGIIDPVAEDVLITVGTSRLVIPAGSFQAKKRRHGVEFQGWVDGVLVHASIEAVGHLTFRYSVEARKVDLSDSSIPLKFSLRMGTDVGLTTIPLHGYLRSGGKHDLLEERRDGRRAIRKNNHRYR